MATACRPMTKAAGRGMNLRFRRFNEQVRSRLFGPASLQALRELCLPQRHHRVTLPPRLIKQIMQASGLVSAPLPETA
jgi:hypothetical protein